MKITLAPPTMMTIEQSSQGTIPDIIGNEISLLNLEREVDDDGYEVPRKDIPHRSDGRQKLQGKGAGEGEEYMDMSGAQGAHVQYECMKSLSYENCTV